MLKYCGYVTLTKELHITHKIFVAIPFSAHHYDAK